MGNVKTSILFLMLILVCAIVIEASQQAQSIDSLLNELKNDDADVAAKAALQLAQMGEIVVPKVFAFIKEENNKAAELYQKAARAAIEIDPDTAGSFLNEGKVHDKNVKAAFLVVWDLDGPAVVPLLELLRTESRLAAIVIEALARIGDKRAIQPLIDILANEDIEKNVKKEASDGLQKMTGQAFGNDPVKWQKWWTASAPKGMARQKLASNPSPSLLNKTVEIVDDGEIYSGINNSDCLSWPSEESRKLGGDEAWGTFEPKKGDRGIVVGETSHCDSGLKMYILKIGRYYVAIGRKGVKPVTK